MKPSYVRKLAKRERRRMTEVYGSPQGECHRWSMNLLSALLDAGAPDPCVIRGAFKVEGFPPHPHSWVEAAGLIIDITADQFNHFSPTRMPSVVVCRAVHAKFHRFGRRLRIRRLAEIDRGS